jgi:2-polyprenyl-3-methyl-5-hydroxy-6-metoxy-1,4-benzoquinol methylase
VNAMSDNFEYVSCPVCHQNAHRKLYEITYFNEKILSEIGIKQIPEATYLCRCVNCDHRYANPQLSDSALNRYYTQINSEYYQGEIEQIDKLLLQHRDIVSAIEKKITKGSILEIGCGNGYLLNLFDKNRWVVTGVEPFGPAASFARNYLGLEVINGYLDSTTFANTKKFDVILLFDVMEHLKQPNEMIELIKYYLKPGGFLVIGTGDISSLNAQLSGKHWSYITLREHLSFYSKASMRYLLKDFTNVEITPVSYIGSFFDNAFTFFKSHVLRRSYNIFQSSHYWLTKFKITRFPYVRFISSFDHMRVIAQK